MLRVSHVPSTTKTCSWRPPAAGSVDILLVCRRRDDVRVLPLFVPEPLVVVMLPASATAAVVAAVVAAAAATAAGSVAAPGIAPAVGIVVGAGVAGGCVGASVPAGASAAMSMMTWAVAAAAPSSSPASLEGSSTASAGSNASAATEAPPAPLLPSGATVVSRVKDVALVVAGGVDMDCAPEEDDVLLSDTVMRGCSNMRAARYCDATASEPRGDRGTAGGTTRRAAPKSSAPPVASTATVML